MTSSAIYLSLEDAAKHIGRSTRWMHRHWPDLVQCGVQCFRVPKNAIKGRLIVERSSLEAYLRSCQITGNFDVFSNES